MGEYKKNNEDDSNEFIISYFINEVFEETVNKETIELKIKKLEMEYDIEKKAYENFYIKVKFYNLVKQ
jgi:hypothetical protein